jgi:hypothetical protein
LGLGGWRQYELRPVSGPGQSIVLEQMLDLLTQLRGLYPTPECMDLIFAIEMTINGFNNHF